MAAMVVVLAAVHTGICCNVPDGLPAISRQKPKSRVAMGVTGRVGREGHVWYAMCDV